MQVFKQIGAMSLLVLLSIKVLVVPVIYLDFEVRKDYIKNYLCENRNRPQLHCDGKCYLAKRLAAAEQKEQTEKGQELNRMLFGAEFLQEFPAFEFQTQQFYTSLKTHFFKTASTKDRQFVIFHPPILG